MHNFVGIIMAAGHGTRMKSNTPKVLHKVFNKTMLHHCATSLVNAGANHLIFIIGHGRELVKKEIESWDFSQINISIAVQEEQLGTGHAALAAIPYIPDNINNIVVMYGDTPLVRSETVFNLIDNHIKNNRSLSLVSTIVEQSTGYGRIVRDTNGVLQKIVEEKDANAIEKSIKEINPGLYCFSRSDFLKSLEKINNNNAQKEYYLTDTIEILLSEKNMVDAMITDSFEDFLGINNRIQLSNVTKIMQKRINESHMLNGVTFIDSSTSYIDNDVVIEQDTIIYPNTTISGKSIIGQSCKIGPNTTIKDTLIGIGSKIESSTIVESIIGNDTNVGPYAYLRPKSKLGNNVKIGDFVEVKNATIGNGSKASHLSYIGDAVVGEGVNLGCGVITVNYDGDKKHITTVEDNVFVGCNSNLIAPVIVGAGAYVAAGTTVTENVIPKALAIGRVRQENKQNWKKK